MTDTIFRKPDVERVTGMSERQLRRLEEIGEFPKRVLLVPGGRAVGWHSSQVQEWIDTRAVAE